MVKQKDKNERKRAKYALFGRPLPTLLARRSISLFNSASGAIASVFTPIAKKIQSAYYSPRYFNSSE